MNEGVNHLNDILVKSWNNFLEALPALVLAIVVGAIGIFVIKYISKLVRRFIVGQSKDTLVIDFLVNLVSIILILFLIVICLSIIGWGSITNKILAGAGITTFVVGFALKDIGENFLAGILMAFQRPFREGDLIEVNNIKGKVMKMSLRETSVKTVEGVDVYIPNSNIIKNPLKNYTIDALQMNEIDLSVAYQDDISNILPVLQNVLKGFPDIVNEPAAKVYIKDISGGNVQLKIEYWIKLDEISSSVLELRSMVLIECFRAIGKKGFSMPSGVVDVKLVDSTEEETPAEEEDASSEEENESSNEEEQEKE